MPELISEISEKEILRQQLKLLAERSKTCLDEDLPEITMAMVAIVDLL